MGMKWDHIEGERTEDVCTRVARGDTGFRQTVAALLIAGAAILALAVVYVLINA
jgi:hypothetical protein